MGGSEDTSSNMRGKMRVVWSLLPHSAAACPRQIAEVDLSLGKPSELNGGGGYGLLACGVD